MLTGHGVDGFEGNDLRSRGFRLRQKFLQVLRVVVPENLPRNTAVPDSLDHGCVISRVRVYLTPYERRN